MSQLTNIIKRLPHPFQKALLTLLYKKNGKILKDYMSFNNGQFYLYDIGGTYIPSEGLSWYLDYDYYLNNVNKVSAFAYKPKKGDVVIDIGAGIGEEVIVFSRMAEIEGKVYAIEANPELFPLLQQVKEKNRLVNVALFNLAINANNDIINIAIDENSFLSGTLGGIGNAQKNYQVPGLRFDSFALQNNIDIIN
jgi:FkbM family methyltransferase